MNKVFLIGNLTRDPEVSMVGENTSARFSIAVRRNFRSKKSGEYETDFFDITVWGKTAEYVSKYAGKGMKVLVEGTLQNREYEKDGQRRKVTDVRADSIELFGPRKTDSPAQQSPAIPAGFTETSDDGLPF